MKRRISPSTVFLLIGICCFALACAACSGFDAVANTLLAVLGSINVVLAAISASFPAPILAAIEAADTVAQGAVSALKAAYDKYVTDKTGTGLLAAVQAAIASVQQSLTQLLAAAHVDNPALQAWIAKVVALVQAVFQDIVTDILPALAPAMTAHFAGNDTPILNLNEKLKAIAAKLKSDHLSALVNSGLLGEAVVAGAKYVNKHTEHSIGPLHI